MAEQKTKPTEQSVEAFLDAVEDPARRDDGRRLCELMQDVTGLKPKMWGPSMVGFGEYHYKYASGHEGGCFLVGFSPRKAALSLYITDCSGSSPELLASLGKFKMGKACIYAKRLDDLKLPVLKKLIRESIAATKKRSKKE